MERRCAGWAPARGRLGVSVWGEPVATIKVVYFFAEFAASRRHTGRPAGRGACGDSGWALGRAVGNCGDVGQGPIVSSSDHHLKSF